jgi:hypothetical protein
MRPTLVAQFEFDKFREERRAEIISLRPKTVVEKLPALRAEFPEIADWLNNLEYFNSRIWCDKCKKRCADHTPDPSAPASRAPMPLSWL